MWLMPIWVAYINYKENKPKPLYMKYVVYVCEDKQKNKMKMKCEAMKYDE